MKCVLLTKDEVLRQIEGDAAMRGDYSRLTQGWKDKFLNFCTGTGGLPLIYDPFFKMVFNPVVHPERLSRLLSLLLGVKLKVRKILPNEGMRILEGGSLLIMDIVVELEDGSIANVEIQKIPYYFPGERAACYSSDLLMRQYSRVRGEKGKGFSYHDMKKVYTVVILEKSTQAFHAFPNAYIHKSKQTFDSGLKMELLQEYTFVALDMFQKIKQNEITGELDAWLHLLSSGNREVLLQIAERYPHFRGIYEEVEAFRKDIGGVLSMFSEALRILDRNTVQLMIDDLREELEGAHNELEQKTDELEQQFSELRQKTDELEQITNELEKKDRQLDIKEKRIKELEVLLMQR